MSRSAADAPPRVSVVICTRNRSADLAQALASLTRQAPGSSPFEVIVVDNGSTDDTPATVARFAADLPLRGIVEPRVGLCHARNAGWRQARGEYVAYLDDDATACPSWVEAIVEGFRSRPEIGVVGGRVDPTWQAPRPAWLRDDVALGLTIVNWSPTAKILVDLRHEWLVGANMAVRADVLREVGGFRPELDRIGTMMLSSGDVFLLKEVVRLGYECLYYPAMAVTHIVAPSRLTKQWFRRRYFWQGVSDAVIQLLEQRPTRLGRAGLAGRAALRLMARPRRLINLLPSDNPWRIAERSWALIDIGLLAGLCGLARVDGARPTPPS